MNNDSFFELEGDQLLNYLNINGVPVQGECYQDICGACGLKFCNAEIQHNDLILSDDEKIIFLRLVVPQLGLNQLRLLFK